MGRESPQRTDTVHSRKAGVVIVNACHAPVRATINVTTGRRYEVFLTIDGGRPLALDADGAILLAEVLQRAAEYAEKKKI